VAQETRALLDLKVPKVLLEHKVLKDLQDLVEMLEAPVHRVHLELWDQLDLQEDLDHLDLQDPQDHKVATVR